MVRATCMTAFAVALANCSGGDGEPAATPESVVADEAATAPTATNEIEAAPDDENAAEPAATVAREPDATDEATIEDSGDMSPTATTAAADDTAPPPDGTESTATTPATTLAPGTPTTDPAAAGVDWTGIATDLLDRHFRIAREPSLDLVAAVCLQPSGCYDDASRTVEVLQRDGVRLRGGAPFDIVSVEFQSTADGAPVDATLAVNLIVRFVATDQGTIQLVDDDGNVVSDVAPDERFPPGQATARAVILGRDSAGAGWKLVALSDWM